MYCPRCSQQQVSEEIKFCSRCGLPLALVAEVLAHDGFLPQLAKLGKKKKLTRRNGLIFSLFWCLFFVLLVTPFFGILDAGELAGMSAIIGIFGGLLIALASYFFLSGEPKNFASQAPVENNFNRHSLDDANVAALPPPQSIPASAYASPARTNWRDTQDLVRPSVTEGTTKLLSKDE
jgi:hypothetical protein